MNSERVKSKTERWYLIVILEPSKKEIRIKKADYILVLYFWFLISFLGSGLTSIEA